MKTNPSTDLVKLVEQIQHEVEATDSRFEENYVLELPTFPIPYFGKLEEASIITVGLNPSPGEFKNNRWINQEITPEGLANQLHNYFERRDVPSHPWFLKWSTALQQLDENARSDQGQVAHIDLSPRATITASQVPKPNVFKEMVRHDLQWLPSLLEFAKAAQILLISGTVNRAKYMIEFLADHGKENSIDVVRSDENGRRSLGFYSLDLHFGSLPVFFSGSSPSARDQGAKLIKNICTHQEQILSLSDN